MFSDLFTTKNAFENYIYIFTKRNYWFESLSTSQICPISESFSGLPSIIYKFDARERAATETAF